MSAPITAKFSHWTTLSALNVSDTDMTAIASMPPRQPDELHVSNTSADTPANLVITNSAGTTLTYSVAPGALPFPLRLDCPVIEDGTGATIVVRALWYGPNRQLNPAP